MNAAIQKRRKIQEAIRNAANSRICAKRTGRNINPGDHRECPDYQGAVALLHFVQRRPLQGRFWGKSSRSGARSSSLPRSRTTPRWPSQPISTARSRHALEYPDISRLFANEIGRGAPEMTEHWGVLKALVDKASEVIRRWVDEGMIRPVDPLLFQMNMWSVTQSYAEYEAQARVLMRTDPDASMDARRIIDEATKLFLLRCGLDCQREVQ